MDSVISTSPVLDNVPAAAYHPATHRVYFVQDNSDTIIGIDPLDGEWTDTIVAIESHSSRSTLVADPARPLLYYCTDQENAVCAIDVLTRMVAWSLEIGTSLDTMYLSPASRKLYISNRRAGGLTYVFDIDADTLLYTLPVGPNDAGVMNERNDKLWLGDASIRVLDCRYDSLVAVLPWTHGDVDAMAWDPINNRVFVAVGGEIGVYRDEPYAVAESPDVTIGRAISLAPNPASGPVSIRLSPSLFTLPISHFTLSFSDVLGRTVRDFTLSPTQRTLTWDRTDRDGRTVPAGIYFCSISGQGATPPVKVVLTQGSK
jgi:hypothetical protein